MFNEKLMQTAQQLVENCKTGKEREGLKTLYADNCVSVEALDMEGHGREAHGIEAISGKHDWWDNSFEVHSAETKGPYLHGDDKFSVIFSLDATHKESGKRENMEEIGLYTVDQQGKICREEFFYST